MILPPINDESNVTALPVEHKEPANGPLMLVPPPMNGCQHTFTSYTVDLRAGRCTCKACGGEVSPMFVLEQLMREESRWQRSRRAYIDEMKRLDERSKTKCRHCGQMTRISTR